MNLRNVLVFDKWLSSASAVLALGGAPLLGSWLGVSAWIPFGIGIALVPWVWNLFDATRQPRLRRKQVRGVAIGNIGWTVASALLLILFPDVVSSLGRWLIAGMAVATLYLGLAQYWGSRRIVRSPVPA
jgi:hypothetical protein